MAIKDTCWITHSGYMCVLKHCNMCILNTAAKMKASYVRLKGVALVYSAQCEYASGLSNRYHSEKSRQQTDSSQLAAQRAHSSQVTACSPTYMHLTLFKGKQEASHMSMGPTCSTSVSRSRNASSPSSANISLTVALLLCSISASVSNKGYFKALPTSRPTVLLPLPIMPTRYRLLPCNSS